VTEKQSGPQCTAKGAKSAGSSIVVRRAHRDDRDAIVEFQLALARETENLRLDPQTVQEGVQAVFDDPRKGTYWIAELDGVVVGCLLTIPEWSDWRNGTILWIHSLYVVPSARGRGVFKALFRVLQSQVAEHSELKALRLYVDKRNKPAQKAYRALGMTDEHYALYEWVPERK